MKLRAMLAAGFVAVMSVVPASAGDYNWSGSYAGLVASGGMYTVEQEDYWCWYACNAPTMQDWDASIGAQAGHNWQNGNFVYGVVVDWSTGFDQEEHVVWDTDNGVIWSAEWESYATLRGRAGLAVGQAQIFGTAGIALVEVDYSATEVDNNSTDCDSVDCAAQDGTSLGFAAGLGVGMPVGDNMHMTFEYLYIGLPWEKDIYNTATNGTDDYVSWTTSAHLARAALVWEFDGL